MYKSRPIDHLARQAPLASDPAAALGALVLPVLQVLGWDIFDLRQVRLELPSRGAPARIWLGPPGDPLAVVLVTRRHTLEGDPTDTLLELAGREAPPRRLLITDGILYRIFGGTDDDAGTPETWRELERLHLLEDADPDGTLLSRLPHPTQPPPPPIPPPTAEPSGALLFVEAPPGQADATSVFPDNTSHLPWSVRSVSLAEASEALDTGAPDLVLLDLPMPPAQGLDALARLVSMRPTAAFVVLGPADWELARRVLQVGAQDYLHRDGLDPGRLIRSLQHAQARHQRAQASAEAEGPAEHDLLTGLLNRLGFDRQLPATSAGRRSPFLLLMDLDDLGGVNREAGLRAGDAVLKHVARQAQACVREGDLLGRIGGDELAVILPATPEAEALRVAERIRRRLTRQALWHEGQALSMSLTILVTPLGDLTSAAQILSRLQPALSATRAFGKNRVTLLPPGALPG